MRKKAYRFLWTLVFGLVAWVGKAQENLSLQAAIEEALKNNYSVRIAQNNIAIAQNEATIGNAGMLPTVAFGAGESFSVNNTQQKLSTGNEINRKGAQSTNTTAGVSLNWTLFDGFRMFIAYERLKTMGVVGELQLRQQMESTVQSVVIAYMEIVNQQQLLNVLDTTISIFTERMNLSKSKWEIGSASKMEYLQSTVDLNEQKSARLNQLMALENAKAQLNVVMGRKAETSFGVEPGISIQKNLNLENLKQAAEGNNATLAYLQKNILVSELALKEIKSGFYPRLIGNAGYTYSRSTNQASIIQLNQNLGLNAGLNLSWTVFDGLNIRRRVKTAQLGIANQKLDLENNRNQTESAVVVAFRKYNYALRILELEQSNHQVAEESALVARERFRAGSSTILELKDVEKALLDANSRLVNAEYSAKLAETELLRLSGSLLGK
jgi:outer membrane protein TolC